jgi:isopentenyl diphosphate isomerase/L-lactate dehydrogenase-like FMN-dependent dehydrogenase
MSEPDDLRVRLSRLDPAPSSLDPVESPRAQELLERIMATPVLTTPTTGAPPPRRRGLVAVWAAAAAVAAIGVASAGISLRDDKPAAPTTLALNLPASGVMASCIQFDVSVLKDMSPAFSGTVTAVDGDTVTLTVDHWYAGGDADQVTLTQPGGGSAVALDGVDFQQGGRYFVTAAQGTVNGCGYSGPASAELEKAFAEAFPG